MGDNRTLECPQKEATSQSNKEAKFRAVFATSLLRLESYRITFFFGKRVIHNEAETLKNEENVCYLYTEKTKSLGNNKRAMLPT